MIREGTKEDFEDILKMAAEFWLETMFEEPFNAEHTQAFLQASYDQNLLAVIEDDGVVGFCCGIKSPSLGSPNAIVGTEMAWWVNPKSRKGGDGIRLMRFIEYLAKKAGIKYWCMIAMESSSPETAEKIYRKLGYRKTETSYLKVF